MKSTIKLLTDSLLHVPMQKYKNDFTFIVNSDKFETNSFFADLLSPIIASRHLIDPTFNEFHINTKSHGDFNTIINLNNFDALEINDDDFSFICEVIEQLGNEKISINDHLLKVQITNDNVIDLIKLHQKHLQYFKPLLDEEIEYVSCHFFELKEKVVETIKNSEIELDEYVFESIICNENLQLESEDQLLDLINELYLKNSKFSRFFEFVNFENVEIESMKEFTRIFDLNDMNASIWSSIIYRLQYSISKQNIKIDEKTRKRKYQTKYSIEIKPRERQSSRFDGILNYLQKHSNIKEEIDITASSILFNDPFNLIQYEDNGTSFQTKGIPNSWIKIEFKNTRIIPSSYVIRSCRTENSGHLRNWVLEGSNDNEEWTILDEQNDNSSLKGSNRIHSFPILNNEDNLQSFKYLRILQTGKNWYNCDDILIKSIEFYGKLI